MKKIIFKDRNPNRALQLTSIQLNTWSLVSVSYWKIFDHARIQARSLFFQRENCRVGSISIVLKFIFRLAGTAQTILAKGDGF